MNKDEALKMAGYDLDGVITDVEKFNGFDDVCLQTIKRVRSTIAEALEQPAQEPVAYLAIDEINGDYMLEKEKDDGIEWTPLYTHPHQWQGLTDDEIAEVLQVKTIHQSGFYEELHLDEAVNLYRAIEQALKEKNHG